jgi:hypothetical protein
MSFVMGIFGITLPTQMREMSPLEYHVVSNVFGPTLPDRARILVTNASGLARRPLTIPMALLQQVGMGPLPAMGNGMAPGIYRTGYLMNVGPTNYASLTGNAGLLVHEMTHVWQGHNAATPVNYVLGSVLAQCLHGGAAYRYVLGKDWTSYNPEQQAAIVEHWYLMGQSTTDPRYPYIDQHVRKGDC